MKQALYFSYFVFVAILLLASEVWSFATYYSYDGLLGVIGTASSATAYNGNDLVGKADAKLDNKKIKVGVVHYSTSGIVIYEGTIIFDGRGQKIEERRISGRKLFNIFRDWPTGH